MEYRSIAELVALAEREGKTIGQIALAAGRLTDVKAGTVLEGNK